MNNNLQFDLSIDKATKKVFITREFDADLALVWDAFTKAEILDQWNAPKPFEAKKFQSAPGFSSPSRISRPVWRDHSATLPKSVAI